MPVLVGHLNMPGRSNCLAVQHADRMDEPPRQLVAMLHSGLRVGKIGATRVEQRVPAAK